MPLDGLFLLVSILSHLLGLQFELSFGRYFEKYFELDFFAFSLMALASFSLLILLQHLRSLISSNNQKQRTLNLDH